MEQSLFDIMASYAVILNFERGIKYTDGYNKQWYHSEIQKACKRRY